MTKLRHRFQLSKSGSDQPLITVTIYINYDAITGTVTPCSLVLHCMIGNQFLHLTDRMNEPFFKNIIDHEIKNVNWAELHKDEIFHQKQIADKLLSERMKDNTDHGIVSGKTYTQIIL